MSKEAIKESSDGPIGAQHAVARAIGSMGIDERVAAKMLADTLATCYGVTARPVDSVWERHRLYIVRRWGLTAGESRIAIEALRGLKNEEIAARAGISSETVKKQLESVYVKCHVRGKAELAARLLEIQA